MAKANAIISKSLIIKDIEIVMAHGKGKRYNKQVPDYQGY
jgi:hypothetical protein